MNTRIRMPHIPRLFLAAACALAVSWTALPTSAGAQESGAKSAEKDTDRIFTIGEEKVGDLTWAVVQANGHSIFGIPVDSGKLTRKQRAEIVANRLQKFYDNGVPLGDPSEYGKSQVRGEYTLKVKHPNTGKIKNEPPLILTIDSKFVQALHRKPEDIAAFWLHLLIKNVRLANIGQRGIGDPIEKDAPENWADIPEGFSKKTQ